MEGNRSRDIRKKGEMGIEIRKTYKKRGGGMRKMENGEGKRRRK